MRLGARQFCENLREQLMFDKLRDRVRRPAGEIHNRRPTRLCHDIAYEAAVDPGSLNGQRRPIGKLAGLRACAAWRRHPRRD